MRYIDAGYVIGLGGLAVYALGLLARRRRLQRSIGTAVVSGDGHEATPTS